MEIRIYYEDTDCGGVVYHSNYLKYMERSRTELLRSIGLDLAHYHTKGLLWAITEVNIKYRYPARYNDLLWVESKITEVSSYRVEFKTEIFNQNGVLCAHGNVKMVGFYSETGKVARFPDEILSILEENCIRGIK